MRDGLCPKCQSATVYRYQNNRVGDTNLISLGPFGFRFTRPYLYVCTTCGYTERYIEDKNFLSDIKQAWEKVGK